MSEEPAFITPRAVLFRTLAALWIFPSLGALAILLMHGNWRPGGDVLGFVSRIPLEQWIAVGILIIHGWLVWRWRRALRVSRPT